MIDIQNLDWAEERKVYVGDDLFESQNHKAIWNVGKNSLGCIASKGYNIIQHREVVRALFQAMKNLNIPFKEHLKEDGHRIFLEIEFPQRSIQLKEVGEEFVCGLLLINSFDKTTGLLILPRVVRKVCANGMIVNKFIPGYSIRHNQKFDENIEGIIEKALKNLINSHETFRMLVEESMADSIEWEMAQIVLLNLLHRKKHVEEIMKLIESKEKIDKWSIYNAITNFCTHGEQIKPNVEMYLQNKAQLLLQTELSKLSDKNLMQVVI